MPRWILALLAPLVLSACDAGHRDNPGADNEWLGPELAIQLPGASTTIRYDFDEAGWAAYKAGEHAPIRAMLHLRALTKVDQAVVRYAVDDGAFQDVEDPTKPFNLPAGLAPGTHLLSAYVVTDPEAPSFEAPDFGPKSAVVAEFHVQVDVTRRDGSVDRLGGPSSTYGHQVGGSYRPFDRNAPQLVVDRRGGTAHVMVVNGRLDDGTLRVRFESAGESLGADSGPFGFTQAMPEDAPALTLERKSGDAWKRVPGARSAWPMPRP